MGLTQEECALRLGFSRARVSAIERRAMTKLRRIVERDPELRELLEEMIAANDRRRA